MWLLLLAKTTIYTGHGMALTYMIKMLVWFIHMYMILVFFQLLVSKFHKWTTMIS